MIPYDATVDWVGLLGLIAAIVVAVPAFVALTQARTSNKLARAALEKAAAANKLGETANALAVEANNYARTEVDLALHDVGWRWNWEGDTPRRMIFSNSSKRFDAHNVHVAVIVDDERREASAVTVTPGGALTLDFPKAERTFELEYATLVAIEDARISREDGPRFISNRRPTSVAPEDLPSPLPKIWEVRDKMASHYVEYEVEWQTKMGVPKRVTFKGTTPLVEYRI